MHKLYQLILGLWGSILLNPHAHAQTDTTHHVHISAYGEGYYSYDFAQPANHEKPVFIYNHKRHNELNINLIYVKSAFEHEKTRANLAGMIGNYAQYNLSAEPIWARFVYEANAGVRLSKKQNLWVDVGILPSHIGFESATGADCWTLTRSILAENSPYYEMGAKLSFSHPKHPIQMAFLLLNGWQKISRPDFMQRSSVGMQFTYKPSDNFTLNYSNFIGNDKPDSLHAWRIFHNLYTQCALSEKWEMIVGVDVGTDKYNAHNYGWWYAPIVITRYSLHKTGKIALRAEWYSDPKQIIITTQTSNGFQTAGFSANYDLQLNRYIQWRSELKTYYSKDPIFTTQTGNTRYNTALTTALLIRI